MKKALRLLVVLTLVLSLCGNALPSLAQASDAALELNFVYQKMDMEDGTDTSESTAWKDSRARFQALYPNVTLVEDVYPTSTYEDKMKALAAANSLPDVFFFKASMVSTLVEAGQIISFDEALAADPAWRDNFKSGMFTEATYKDQVWAVPRYCSMNGMVYYNREILHELGYEAFPDTYAQMWEMLEKAKAAGYIPAALGNADGWESFSLFQNALLYRYTGAEWFEKILNREDGATFTDPEFVAAATEGARFAGEMFNEDWYEINADEMRALFTSGEALMLVDGSWCISMFEASDMPSENIGLTALPLIEGNDKGDATVPGSTGWMLFISSSCSPEKRAVAIDLVKCMSDAQYATVYATAGGFPAQNTSDSFDPSAVSAMVNEHNDVVARCGQSLVVDCVMNAEVTEALYTDTASLFLGIITPEQYAAGIQAQYEGVK